MSSLLYPVYVRQGKSPKNFKAGFINKDGKDVLEARFDDAEPFRDGLASVQAAGRWGAINLKGDLVIPCNHQGRLNFHQGLSSYADRSRRGLLRADGAVVLHAEKYWAISCFSDGGMAYVWDGSRYGFINKIGEEVIPPRV